MPAKKAVFIEVSTDEKKISDTKHTSLLNQSNVLLSWYMIIDQLIRTNKDPEQERKY